MLICHILIWRYKNIKFVNEITWLEKEKRHQELKVYIDAIWPLIDERLTFKRWSVNSSERKSLQGLKTYISSIPESKLVPRLEIFFMD